MGEVSLMKIESVEQPRSNNGNATIDLLVKFSHLPEKVWFTATPYDPEDYGRELYQRALNGEFGEIA